MNELYLALETVNLADAKMLLNTGSDIYLKDILISCMTNNDDIVLESLIKLHADINAFRSEIIDFRYSNPHDNISTIIQMLNNYTFPTKEENLVYMLIYQNIIEIADVSNYILKYYILLICKTNFEYDRDLHYSSL